MSSPEGKAANSQPIGKAALIASVGGQRGYADWANPDHRLRRLLAEFIGMAGLTFILSGGAAATTAPATEAAGKAVWAAAAAIPATATSSPSASGFHRRFPPRSGITRKDTGGPGSG